MYRIDAINELCKVREETRLRLNSIADESGRVASVARNAHEIIENLDAEFTKATSLDDRDIGFLIFATFLQVARWLIIEKVSKFGQTADQDSRLDHDDKSILSEERKKRDEFKSDHYKKGDEVKQGQFRDWMQIVFDSAPYDATAGWEYEGNHRLMSIGHDPLFGWIFGTMNFITTSLTTNRFITHKVVMHPLHATAEVMTIPEVIKQTIESAKEDKMRIPAAIFAQGLHLKSDEFTKMGLPIPVLGTFAPELAGALYAEHYDYLCAMRDLKTVGAQAFFSVLIDLVVGLVHGLYFDPAKYESRKIYEVKTRKILCYSKVIAESSNILQVAIRTMFGDASAWKSLDFGGIGWMLIDIMRSAAFIREVKEEFIFGQFNQMIQGSSTK